MRGCLVLLGALLLLGATCETLPTPPRSLATPPVPPPSTLPDFEVPTPTWPLRLGTATPAVPGLAPVPWRLPAVPDTRGSTASATPGTTLPLPGVVNLPVKVTAASRSWTATAPAKAAPLALPTAPSPKATTKPATSAEAKAKAPVPATPQPVPKPAATVPPTAAATASLLPVDKTNGPDFGWQDVNAVLGDAVTLHFEKTNWLYLDSPAQQKTLGFQSITRDKDATTFLFRPTQAGNYVLEFQRQDLANQSTDVRKVKLTVAPTGTRTSATTTTLAPQTSTKAAADSLEASRQLAAAGKTSEAVQRLLQTYRADDTRTNLELARLLNQDGQDDQALSYLEKNLTLTGPDLPGTLELGTKLAALKDPTKKLPPYVKLWLAGTSAPPEDLYLQVLDALRAAKSPQTKDWLARYSGWYPDPKLRDRYLYQVGQFLEEPGEGRDVRAAWKAYDEVVRLYPLSPYWKPAGERASYLNRHFLQVR